MYIYSVYVYIYIHIYIYILYILCNKMLTDFIVISRNQFTINKDNMSINFLPVSVIRSGRGHKCLMM